MARFYKGVGVGTFLHNYDVSRNGIPPHQPGGSRLVQDMIDHITSGTAGSACVSLTQSYAIALGYAKGFGTSFPTSSTPAYVYEIELADNRTPGMQLVDPVCEIARTLTNLFQSPSYRHDSDRNFLLGVVDPARFLGYIAAAVSYPGAGITPRGGRLSGELEALVRALRDAEVLVIGHIPSSCVKRRYDVF